MNKLLKLILCIGMLCGCSSNNSSNYPSAETISPFDVGLYNELANANLFDGSMIELSNDQIKGYYQHPDFDTLVLKAQVYTSSDTSINEVAIFEAESEFEVVIMNRIDELKRSASLYFPIELEKINNYVLYKKDSYFILVIGNDEAKITEIIEKIIE